mmetsp:Transcript_34269/g.53461  ORF Transcript_34269/g.53461 Transcript_34269/m.53461 type:complete len:292 (+) Transcript_34269:90-965(+)|eukprot:CAMPEP_0184294918 /NCGR_PEP_ID=MMETSP1049-20130417/5970_1 /TAXON_ID=77928 /ORGANISM="Proteomonas sulcata, Strain CCMP704" /LENGTH=291 /DNA_ID=CAMNT_0026603337 /DNA_START=89 /DNA_END=964 /DNA_ORIENTATION=-
MSADIGLILKLNPSTKEWQIADLEANGAASKTGMVAVNDVLLKIGGTEIQGKSLTQVKTLMQGEAKTKVRLKLRRGQDRFDATLLRGTATSATAPKVVQPKSTEPKDQKNKKMTDREKADMLLNGGNAAIIHAHDPRQKERRATAEEAARIKQQQQDFADEKQAEADQEYETATNEEIQRLRNETDKNKAELWKILTANPFDGWGPWSKSDADDEKDGKKRGAGLGWHKKAKQTYKKKKQEAKVAIGMAIIQHKFEKGMKSIWTDDNPKDSKSKSSGSGVCNFCAAPRKKA